VESRFGVRRRVTDQVRAHMLALVESQADITIAELRERIEADIFLAYLDHVLCPELRQGDVVVMDNLSSHKVQGVCERIERTGSGLLYLPPYSPDLNPIEKAWAKLKQLIRSAKPHNNEALQQTIADALPKITPQNAQAWFQLTLNWVQV
jgi:transposase